MIAMSYPIKQIKKEGLKNMDKEYEYLDSEPEVRVIENPFGGGSNC